MVINSLSIDPECLNLPQKYLTIYMAPFLSFVSSTSKETPEWRKKVMVLSRQEAIELQISILLYTKEWKGI